MRSLGSLEQESDLPHTKAIDRAPFSSTGKNRIAHFIEVGCWAMCAADAWALYNAIINSHPIVVDAYNAYRRSIVDGLVRLHNEGNSEENESCLPPTEDELVDRAMDNLLLSLQCIGACLPPVVADPPVVAAFVTDKQNSWVFNDARFGDIILLDTYEPRPDGVMCTNEDPKKCAVCLTASIYKGDCIHMSNMNFCCGTLVCDDCSMRTHLPDFCGWICRFCGQVSGGSGRYLMMERQSGQGRPWAQYFMGMLELRLYRETGDATKAIPLLEEAASQGHPDAMIFLSEVLVTGMGVPIDRRRAVGFALHALEVEPVRLFERACRVACGVASSIVNGDPSLLGEVISILAIFIRGGSGDANLELMKILSSLEHHAAAFEFLECGLICYLLCDGCDPCTSCCNVAAFALNYYIDNDCIPELQFFYTVFSKVKKVKVNTPDWMLVSDKTLMLARSALIKARHSCAHCGRSLDARNRKMCKNCRGACYCSRKCQKKHWNRVDNKSHKHGCESISTLRSIAVDTKEAVSSRENLDVRGAIDYLKDLNVIP